MRPVETIPGMGGEGKKNDGGGELSYDNSIRTFVNVTMYPQYNNKKMNENFQEVLKSMVILDKQ
jgi:hypothetical protein